MKLISNLPTEIKEVALKRQIECSSKEYEQPTDKLYNAFDWSATIEGADIWESVQYGMYDSFYKFHNNNGWIKINEEKDLPVNEMEYYWVIGENYSIHQVIFHEGITDIWLSRYSHYQPVIKPEKPIY